MARTYNTTCQMIIDKVRYITNDTKVTYRNSDAEIIGWINNCVDATLSQRPLLFATSTQIMLDQGYWQTVTSARAHSIIDLVGVPQADVTALTKFRPNWMLDAFGPIQNWMPLPNSPLSFYCYPPSQAGQLLYAIIATSPVPMDTPDDLIPLPETYEGAVVAYCVSMVEAKDDESVLSQRSAQFMQDYVGRIKGM